MDSAIFLVLAVALVLLSVLLLFLRVRDGPASSRAMPLLVSMVALAAITFVLSVATAHWLNAGTFGALTVSYTFMIVQARQARRSG